MAHHVESHKVERRDPRVASTISTPTSSSTSSVASAAAPTKRREGIKDDFVPILAGKHLEYSEECAAEVREAL